MPITLDDIDAILGFDLPALGHSAALKPCAEAETPSSAPTCYGVLPAEERTRRRKRPDQEGITPGQCSKKRRMTTEEKVRKFLDGGKWNALLGPGESALSAEFTSKVATAASAMGLPDRVPPAPAHDVLAEDAMDADENAAPLPLSKSKPTYKSIDNLLCLAVAAPAHCNQQHIGRPQPKASGLVLTSNASFCRTPEPLSAAAVTSGEGCLLPEPNSTPIPTLSSPSASPARPAAASSLSPAVSIEMGMPKMWRSHSGTQLSCF